MKNATYLVRFDDICPTMNWESWDKVEKVLVSEGIKPMLAVVPDNRDQNLVAGQENEHFWSKVRSWQEMGWSIAIHGYQHRYQTFESGLMKLNKYSEFSGLPYSTQSEYLQKALSIFHSNNIYPELWIAPAHSFDKVTIKVLDEMGINVISDGFYARPVNNMGMTWIPQQLWKFRNFPFGIWTVCYHLNKSSYSEIDKICYDLKSYSSQIRSLQYVLKNVLVNKLNIFDLIFSFIWRALLKFRIILGRFR
tara:strand:- start:33 stop:782 length:750 start_codon:yes stop_codon:yes gene_type:complete